MVDLGQRRDGTLESATTRPLLDRDCRWNAMNRIEVGARCRLHELPRVGIERFEIAALAFIEEDIERQRRFARTRDTGDDGEAATRNLDIDALEVVLARTAHDHLSTGRGRTVAARWRLGDHTHGLRGVCVIEERARW